MQEECDVCGSDQIEVDESRGDVVCTSCGAVLTTNVVSEIQFEENAHGGHSAIGQFVSINSTGGTFNTTGPDGQRRLYQNCQEATLNRAKKGLSNIAQQLKLSQHCIDVALNLYKNVLIANMTRGRRAEMTQAACMYIISRVQKTGHMLIDFAEVCQLDVFQLGHTMVALCGKLSINLPNVDPCLFVIRYANQMQLKKKTRKISNTALRLVQRMKKDSINTGRRPAGLCGAALLMAARFHNVDFKLSEMVKIVKIQEMTIKKRLLEFSKTASANLKLSEFMEVDLEGEHFPPSFDEKEKEIVDDPKYIERTAKLADMISKKLVDMGAYKKTSADISAKDISSEVKVVVNANTPEISQVSTIVTKTICEEIKSQNTVSRKLPRDMKPTLELMGITGRKIVPNTEESFPFTTDYTKIDLSAIDVDDNFFTEEQIKVKNNLVEEKYGEFLKEREEKRLEKLRKEGEKPPKKRRKIATVPTDNASAAEAIEQLYKVKKLSSKIDYEVLKKLIETAERDSEMYREEEKKEVSGGGGGGGGVEPESEDEDEDDVDEPEEPDDSDNEAGRSSYYNRYEDEDDFDYDDD